jgi:heme-degrading monooxygenase HmoA
MESNVFATEPGVIRLFRFRPVRAAFDLLLRQTMVPALLDLPGLDDLYVGRRGPDELGPRLIATVWDSRIAMASALGESFEQPVFLPEYLDETEDRELDFLPLGFGYRFERPERPGLLRLVQGEVADGGLDEYIEQARAGTLADAQNGRGPLALYLARRSPEAFVTLSIWSDWATLQEATGGNVDRPIATRHARMLSAWQAEHYEAVPDLWAPPRAVEIDAAAI